MSEEADLFVEALANAFGFIQKHKEILKIVLKLYDQAKETMKHE